MRKIQKQAQDLVAGDVLTDSVRPLGLVLTRARTTYDAGIGKTLVCIARIGSISGGPVQDERFQPLAVLDVADFSTPELTPAQQRADELLKRLRELRGYYAALAGGMGAEVLRDVDELLAKLQPPEPPELTEALDVLRRGGWGEEEIDVLRAYALKRPPAK